MQPLDSLSQFLWCLTGNKPLQYILPLCVCVMVLVLAGAQICPGELIVFIELVL